MTSRASLVRDPFVRGTPPDFSGASAAPAKDAGQAQSSMNPADAKAQAVAAELMGQLAEIDRGNITGYAGEQVESADLYGLQYNAKWDVVVKLPRPEAAGSFKEEEWGQLQHLFSTYKLSNYIDIFDLITVHFFQLFKKIEPFVPAEEGANFIQHFTQSARAYQGTGGQDAVSLTFEIIQPLTVAKKSLEQSLLKNLGVLALKKKNQLIKFYGDPEHTLQEWSLMMQLLGRCLITAELRQDNLTGFEEDGSASLNVGSVEEVDQCLHDLALYAEMISRLCDPLHCQWIDNLKRDLITLSEKSKKLSKEQKAEAVAQLIGSIYQGAKAVWELKPKASQEETAFNFSKGLVGLWVENVVRVLEHQVVVHLDDSYPDRNRYLSRIIVTMGDQINWFLGQRAESLKEDPLKSSEGEMPTATSSRSVVQTQELPEEAPLDEPVEPPSDPLVEFVVELLQDQRSKTAVWLSWGFSLLHQQSARDRQRIIQTMKEFVKKTIQRIRVSEENRLDFSHIFLLAHDLDVYLGLRKPGLPFPDEYIELLILVEERENLWKKATVLSTGAIMALPPATETPKIMEDSQAIQPPSAEKSSTSQGTPSGPKASALKKEKQPAPVAPAISQPEHGLSTKEEIMDVLKLALKEMFHRKKRKREELLRAFGYELVEKGGGKTQGKGSHTCWARRGEDGKLYDLITVPNADETSVGVINKQINTIAQAIAEQIAASHLLLLGFVPAREGSYDVWTRKVEDGRLLTLITDHQEAESTSQAQSSADPASQPSKPERYSKKK